MEGSAHRRWSTAGECKHSAPLLLLSSHPTALSEPLTLLLDSPLTDRHRRALHPAWLTCVRSVSPNQARPPPSRSQADMDKQRPFSRAYRSFYSAGKEDGGIVVHLGSGAAASANGAKEALQGGRGEEGAGGGAGDAEEGSRGTPDDVFEGTLRRVPRLSCTLGVCGNGLECIYL